MHRDGIEVLRGDRDQHCLHRIGAERQPTCEHLVRHDADRPQVGARIDPARIVELLGRHVRRRAELRIGRGPHAREARVEDLRDAEIEELDLLLCPGEEHVLGLQIAVHEAARVGRVERIEELEEDPPCVCRGQLRARHRHAQRAALQQLHHEVEQAIGCLAGIDHGDDAGVADRVRRARLGEEPHLDLGVEREVILQDLDRDLRPRELVVRLEHEAHAARADDGLDGVSAVDDSSRPARLDHGL